MSLRMFNWTSYPSVSESTAEILVLYEDAAMRAGVREALSAAMEMSGKRQKCRLSEWKFSVLESAGMLRQAVQEAITADIVIVCARGSSELPEAVKHWLEEWLRQKTTSKGVLLGLVDAAFAEGRTSRQIFTCLMNAASQAAFDWQPGYFRSTDVEESGELTRDDAA